jgi:hypothetical protein
MIMRDVLGRAMATGAIVVLASLALAGPAVAQDARIDAAKKEGKVVWYTSLALPSAEKVAELSGDRAGSGSIPLPASPSSTSVGRTGSARGRSLVTP